MRQLLIRGFLTRNDSLNRPQNSKQQSQTKGDLNLDSSLQSAPINPVRKLIHVTV